MRIWVARPEPGATRTGARLAALGHIPLVAPVLTLARTGASVPGGRFDGLILTSANAVDALDEADRRRLAGLPVFAVGARTAAPARAAGFAEIREAGGDAAALSGLIRTILPTGARLLHVAGADRKPEPAASLTRAGYRVVAVTAYAAAPVEALPPAVMRALDGIDEEALGAVIHYSRRSAATAHDLAVAAGRRGAFLALTHYCLSADVAAPLVAAGVAAHVVPDRPTEDALLAGLPVHRGARIR